MDVARTQSGRLVQDMIHQPHHRGRFGDRLQGSVGLDVHVGVRQALDQIGELLP